jgi:hypothetical protein
VKHLTKGPYAKMQQLIEKKDEQGELNEKEDKQLKDLIK